VNVALEILDAEERVPGAGWSFEPPAADAVDDLRGVDPDADTLVGLQPTDPSPAGEEPDDLVPGMRSYHRTDGAVYADARGTAAEVSPWMLPMMTMSLIAALFLAVYVLAR